MLSALLVIVLLSNGFNIPELLLVMVTLNVLVTVYIYTVVTEFLMRFLVWLLIHPIYRVKKEKDYGINTG